MCLRRDRPVRDGAGREAGEDAFGRFDLVERHRRIPGNELQQVADRGRRARVHDRGVPRVQLGPSRSPGSPVQRVSGVHLVVRDLTLRAGCVRPQPLQRGVRDPMHGAHHRGLGGVMLAAVAELHVPRVRERTLGRTERARLPLEDGGGHVVQSQSAEHGLRGDETRPCDLVVESQDVDGLRAAIAVHARDAELGERLADAVLDRLAVAGQRRGHTLVIVPGAA